MGQQIRKKWKNGKSMKKARTEDEQSMVGFIHGLSPVKISKKNSRYFDATLQPGRQEYRRVVVFGPEKHKVFEQAAISKTPVKLSNVRKSIGYRDPNGFDVLCSADSKMQVVDNLPFFFRGSPTAGTLWEDKIVLVAVSHSYESRHVTMRRCGEQTFLTSTPSTTIHEIQDVGEPHKLEPHDDDDGGDLVKVSGRVTAVQIGAKQHCVRCRGSQTQFNRTCTSHRCKRCRMLQRAESYRVLYSGTVVVVSDGQESTVTLTNSAINMFVAKHMDGVASDSEAIEEKLISV